MPVVQAVTENPGPPFLKPRLTPVTNLIDIKDVPTVTESERMIYFLIIL